MYISILSQSHYFGRDRSYDNFLLSRTVPHVSQTRPKHCRHHERAPPPDTQWPMVVSKHPSRVRCCLRHPDTFFFSLLSFFFAKLPPSSFLPDVWRRLWTSVSGRALRYLFVSTWRTLLPFVALPSLFVSNTVTTDHDLQFLWWIVENKSNEELKLFTATSELDFSDKAWRFLKISSLVFCMTYTHKTLISTTKTLLSAFPSVGSKPRKPCLWNHHMFDQNDELKKYNWQYQWYHYLYLNKNWRMHVPRLELSEIINKQPKNVLGNIWNT